MVNAFLNPVYVRGEAYLSLRNGSAAAVQFQNIIDHRGVALNSPVGALAHLGLARAYALQGDTPKAHAKYQDFLSLEKRRPRHPHPEGSQGGVCQAEVSSDG